MATMSRGAPCVRRAAVGRWAVRRVPTLFALCAGLAAVAAAAGGWVAAVHEAAFAITGTQSPVSKALARRGSRAPPTRTARCAEQSFDPFGWKGKLKDTFQGILDGINPQEETLPSKVDEQMILEIFEKFDLDKDGVLNLEEFNALQIATEGPEAIYNLDQLKQLLGAVNGDIKEPERGMPFTDYRRLYVERRLRQSYGTDVSRDHMKIFGPGGPRTPVVEAETVTAGIVHGTAVLIEGLAGAVELNGQTGIVVEPVATEAAMVAEGRVIVRLGDGERVALKPANVKAA